MHRPDQRVPTAACVAAVILFGSAVLTGCESGITGSRSAREIALAEFSRGGEQQESDAAAHSSVSADADSTSSEDDHGSETAGDQVASGNDPAGEGDAGDAESRQTLPRLGAGEVSEDDLSFGPEPGTRVIVDSLVGEVNGRPIYADSFFEPIEDQLRAIAQRATQREFINQATEVISEHLGQIVRNELFLADARSQLTPEQRQGLFSWMRAMREQEILQGGGTQTAAARRVQEQHGMTMDEYLAARRDVALLQKLQEERISPRVIVSWRDIEREYQRRFHEFNPPARMKVSRIRLSTERDGDLIERVKEQLAAGEDFAEVAAAAGMRDHGAWQEFQLGEAGGDGLELSENIKERGRGLDGGGCMWRTSINPKAAVSMILKCSGSSTRRSGSDGSTRS